MVVKDKYDEQISLYTSHKNFNLKVKEEWFRGTGFFSAIGPLKNLQCGCLVIIRDSKGLFKAFIDGKVDEELTQQIVKDKRIPTKVSDITKKNLPVFAEWWRKIDSLTEQKQKS